MDFAATFEVPVHVMARQVGEDTVILDLLTGHYFGLDPVGARIWTLLAQRLPLDQVCQTLLTEFDVPRETLERDMKDLVQTLLDRQLVRLDN